MQFICSIYTLNINNLVRANSTVQSLRNAVKKQHYEMLQEKVCISVKKATHYIKYHKNHNEVGLVLSARTDTDMTVKRLQNNFGRFFKSLISLNNCTSIRIYLLIMTEIIYVNECCSR